MKAIALIALSLALEAGFLFQIALHAPATPAAATTDDAVARVVVPAPSRG
jgi:hypothetical protein